MRKISFIWHYMLSLSILLTFNACKKHDEEPIDPQELLPGTWQSEWLSEQLFKDGKLVHDIENADTGLRVILNADGTFILSERDINGNWNINPTTGSWYYSDGMFVSIYDEDDCQETYTLKNITVTTLELEANLTWEENQSVYSAYYSARYQRMTK